MKNNLVDIIINSEKLITEAISKATTEELYQALDTLEDSYVCNWIENEIDIRKENDRAVEEEDEE